MRRLRFLISCGILSLFVSCDGQKESIGKAKTPPDSGDVVFAKSAFEALAKGDSNASEMIDWPVFTSLGDNVGATYSAFSTELEKQKFVTGFITQFATSFRESGGSLENFTNWRVTFHDPQKTEVAADSPSGALVMVVAERNDVEKVASMNIIR